MQKMMEKNSIFCNIINLINSFQFIEHVAIAIANENENENVEDYK